MVTKLNPLTQNVCSNRRTDDGQVGKEHENKGDWGKSNTENQDFDFWEQGKMIIFFKGTATTTGRVLMLWPTRLSSIMSKLPRRTQTVYIVNSRLQDEGLQVTI